MSHLNNKYQASGQNLNDEELREVIRRRIEERMKIYSNKTNDENVRKQLRDEIKTEIINRNVIKSERIQKSEQVLEPGPSFQPDNDDEDPVFQEQLIMALELSKFSMLNETSLPKIENNLINLEKTVSNKLDKEIECGICFDTTTDPISYGCDHQFCVYCVTTNLKNAITEGLITSMQCPETECKVSATQALVRRLVSEEMFERYETLLLKSAIADMDNIVYCSNGDCGAIIEAEADIGFATCHRCGHTFCTNCSKPFHGTSDCELTEIEREHMVQLYQDELIAERLLEEESQNQLVIEAMERENQEWIKTIREEQNAIRLQEQIENEELERQQEENRRLEAERVKAEEEQREKERVEYERIVAQNKEKERLEKLKIQERKEQDIQSENTVRQVTKPCPSCKSPIEKNGGCVWIKCAKCQYEFCWQCMRPLQHSQTYTHHCI